MAYHNVGNSRKKRRPGAMKRQEWNHDKLEGVDADIETSLKEYGIAWIIEEKETLFYYGIRYEGQDFNRFDFCSLSNDIDIKEEYDWIEETDWQSIVRYVGMDMNEWLELPLTAQIFDLMQYYGYQNIFGECYWEGLKYEDIVKGDIEQ
jgi:hypothetical protein